jgi:hypothetical protein
MRQIQCPVLKLVTLSLGEIPTGTLSPGWGSLKCETVKYLYFRESSGTRTRERLPWPNPATTFIYTPVLLLQMVPHINNPQLSKDNDGKERKQTGHGSQMGIWHEERLTDRPSIVM